MRLERRRTLQNSEMGRVEVKVPHWMAEMIREKAAERGLTANEMFEVLLRMGLELTKELKL